MSSLWCFLLIFLLSLFQTCFLSSPSSPQLCHHDERYSLMQLKQKHYYLQPDDNPDWVFPYSNLHIIESWNSNTDCCNWEGITCDGTTGHVVGLDLTFSSLYGSIHSNSSLFDLRHLQMLSLSWNDFDYFDPSGFERLSRLMHLNLSHNLFSGQIPSQISQLKDLVSLDLSLNHFMGQVPVEISRLTKLVFLDLSASKIIRDYSASEIYSSFSRLEIPNLRALVQNLSNLRELHLNWVDLSGQKKKDWCRHLSSALPNLHVLSMMSCSLTGPLDASISSLHFLSELYLDFNTNLTSTVPSSLVNLTSLTALGLRSCGLHGDFLSDIFLLPRLRYIELSTNPLLSVRLPEFPQVNGTLQYLSAGNTKFLGNLPSSIGNLKFLKKLYLWSCNIAGPIPSSLANLTHLTVLTISQNSFSGKIPSLFRESFPNLEVLNLGNNLLEGPIHSYLFFLPSLYAVGLSYNLFSEVINEPIHNVSSSASSPRQLTFSLSGNYLKGQDLIRSISKIKGTFVILDLSFNDFGYMVEDSNISYDSLSINGSVDHFINAQIQRLAMSSCNISKFPADFLSNQKELNFLDLSSNRIGGAIPNWIWQQNLLQVNLSNNLLTGLELPLPNHSSNIKELALDSNMMQDCLSTAPCFQQTTNLFKSEFVSPILENLTVLLSKASFFSISYNKLTGNIPISICNASYLEILDLSNNQLSGTIPATCLSSTNLGVLNLERNKLHGPIPLTSGGGCSLQSLKLSRNMLQGHVPRSLAECMELELLDIGDNQLTGTFPYWLENLSKLQVLVMRSNNFGGPIGQLPHVDSPFPSLHVFDISSNTFTGNLPLQYILHWKAMMTDTDNSKLSYVNFDFVDLIQNMETEYHYKYTIAIVDKGMYLEMGSILTALTAVDLSNNKFSGGIPDAMGNLKPLVLLNLSGNSLMGQIPSSLGNLSNLEALDLSRNNLFGQIPSQLLSLTFLSFLNLSDNNLTGSIPQGNQFSTFLNTSYEGNPGLCGFPLSRKCGITNGALPPMALQQEDESASLLDWRFFIAGYCSGMIIGVITGQQLFWRNNRCSMFSLKFGGSR